MYKYLTYNNTYRYIDDLPKFVKVYNDTVHSAIGMAPSQETDMASDGGRDEARSIREGQVSRRAARAYQ